MAVLAGVTALWLRPEQAPVRSPAFPPAPAPALIGKRAPDFTLPLLAADGAGSGGRLALHSLRGHPVLLNFWASWCAPCRAETPLLMRLYQVYGPRGVSFVGVDVQDDAADARRFVGQYHVGYTVVASRDETVMTSYAILGLPTTVFIDADGVIRDRQVGGFIGPDGEKALAEKLERLLRSAR